MFYRYLINRLLWAIPVMLLVSILVFSLIHFIPGDPVVTMLGSTASYDTIEAIRSKLFLDRPVIVQYFMWLGNVLKGDLGNSIVTGEPVSKVIFSRLPATVILAFTSLLIAAIIAIFSGITAAHKRNTIWDISAMFFSVLGISIPAFWLGIMFIILFALALGWLPAMGYVSFFESPIQAVRHLAIPALSLGLINAGYLTRVIRTKMLDVLGQDYINMARAKGVKESVVVYRHAFKNASIPIVTVIGIQLAKLMGGTIIVELIFAWPGIGRLVLQAINSRDYPVVQGVVLISAFIFVLMNLIVDLIYRVLDPRVELS